MYENFKNCFRVRALAGVISGAAVLTRPHSLSLARARTHTHTHARAHTHTHTHTYTHAPQVRDRVSEARKQLKRHEHALKDKLDRDAADLELALCELEH